MLCHYREFSIKIWIINWYDDLASVPFFERFSVQILESATAAKGVMSKKVKLAWFQSKINYIDRIFYLSRVVEYVWIRHLRFFLELYRKIIFIRSTIILFTSDIIRNSNILLNSILVAWYGSYQYSVVWLILYPDTICSLTMWSYYFMNKLLNL